MPDALYLVDGSGFIFRAYHALPKLSTRQGIPTGAVYGFAQMLIKLEQDHRPSHLAVVLDAGGHSFRDELYADYKAQRPEPPGDLLPQFGLVREVVSTFGVPLLELRAFEADDVIATLAREARERGLRVVIVSSDKDLMQLVSDNIVLHDTMKDLTYTPAEVMNKFGVPPEKLGDVLALMGDSVDNVPGVPGIGPKTAAALVQEFGSLEGLLGRIDEVKVRGAERIKEALRSHAESARLSRKLVALDEHVPLPIDLESLRRREPEMAKVEKLFRDLEFDRLLQRLRPASSQPPQPAVPVAEGTSIAPLAALAGAMPLVTAVPATPAFAIGAGPVRVIVSDADLAQLAGELERAGELALCVEMGEGRAHAAPLCGLAFSADGLTPAYLPLGHRYLGVPSQLSVGAALDRLAPLLSASAIRKHLHQSKRGLLALAQLGASVGGIAGDPQLASYLLDPAHEHDLPGICARYGVTFEGREALCGTGKKARLYETIEHERAAAYAGRAAVATLGVSRLLAREVEAAGMGSLLRDVELPLGRVLSVMEGHGVRLDTGHLASINVEVESELRRLEAEVARMAGVEINLGSPKQLQELLFDKLQLPATKKTKTGYSTDAEVLEELAPLHPIAATIHAHRALAKLKSTYIDQLPSLVDQRTGRLHTSWDQAVAATGRISSSEPNLQNIPIRSDVGMKIRRAFIADPGNLLIAADYSQIELRVVAHLSHDAVLCDAFTKGQDVHQRTACEVFSVTPESVTPEQRRVAKAINFGIVYGQTDYGLSRVLGIDRGQAKQYIEGYFARYSGVAGFMEQLIRDGRRDGGARTLLGRVRPLPDLQSKNRTVRQYAERTARNTPIQGTAADLLKLAMIAVAGRLATEAPSARMLLTVHDELVLEAPAPEAVRVGELVRETMERVWRLDVPLQVDVGVGPNWAEC